ncbi:MAG: polysaccharide deacetylase family protein [Clostridia bacterium]|nr:polysaccharide deacetylase family protein [Clostridia bacterium]
MLLTLWAGASAEGFNYIVRNGERDQKHLCVTVDDCADSQMIQAIFDLSREMETPITFFTNGYTLKDEDRELRLSIAQSDCEIGNHCYAHKSLNRMNPNDIIYQLNKCQRRLDEVLGYHYPMQMMRPPFGNVKYQGSTWKVRNAVKRRVTAILFCGM